MFASIGSESHAFAQLPAPEIKEIATSDGSVLVIPVGSIEQHGDHLPVATDTMLVSHVVSGAIEQLDELPVLSTPPVWCGYSPHHLSLGGTVSGEFETLRAHLTEIATTGLQNGFDAAIFVNGHGGNKALIEAVVSEVGADHPETEVLGTTYFELDVDLIDDVRDSETGGMAHGGEFETSLLLYLDDELVGEDRPATYFEESYDLAGGDLIEGGPLAVYRSFEEYSASGAIGDPSLASSEKGKQLYNGLTDALSTCIREINAHQT